MSKKILLEILNNSFIENIEDGIAHLKEKEKNATLNSIKIELDDINYLLIKCDKLKGAEDNFKDSTEIHNIHRKIKKRCDYLLVSDTIAYFIEIKSTNTIDKVREDCRNKFKAVECITEYIDAVIQNFYDNEKVFSKLEKRFVLFYQSLPINKQTTSAKPKKEEVLKKLANNTAENFHSFSISNNATIKIEQLIS